MPACLKAEANNSSTLDVTLQSSRQNFKEKNDIGKRKADAQHAFQIFFPQKLLLKSYFKFFLSLKIVH